MSNKTISFFLLSHLGDKCHLMLWAIAGELHNKMLLEELAEEQEEFDFEELNRLISSRLSGEIIDQRFNWSLSADPDEDLCPPTEVVSEEDDYEDPDFSMVDFTEEINLDDIYHSE